jgi:hypothetical protein
MTNILTAAEAAKFVRTDDSDPIVAMLLPQVDSYIENATGRDWTQDGTILDTAKSAAGILLVAWYDDPSLTGQATPGVYGPLVQLEAEARKYRKYQFYGSNGAGAVRLDGAHVGDVVQKLIGVYGSSGSQAAKFESTITAEGEIQQSDTGDLSENIYVVVLKSPADDVGA